MRKKTKLTARLLLAALVAVAAASCNRQIFYEDGAFDNEDLHDEQFMINAEIDNDDLFHD